METTTKPRTFTEALALARSDPGTCNRCYGYGLLANDDEESCWLVWAELPPGSDLAVKMGIVRAVECRFCGGTGRKKPTESEAGPADGGAPDADWAELDREGMAAFAERYPTAAAEPDDDARDPESEGLGVSGENPVLGHYSPSPGILVLGTNGGHDRADAAGIPLDPDKVTATLTEAGWSIAYTHPGDGRPGEYINNESGFPYNTWEVEAAYRAALAGRAR